MAAQPRRAAPLARPLEGPGAEARLRRVRAKFARMHRALERPGPPWRLPLLCLATFAAVVAAGLVLMRWSDGRDADRPPKAASLATQTDRA
jgi:hypothetical protein